MIAVVRTCVIAVLLACALVCAWSIIQRSRRRGRCPVCGYPPPEPGSACPECGRAPDAQRVFLRMWRRKRVAQGIFAIALAGVAGYVPLGFWRGEARFFPTFVLIEALGRLPSTSRGKDWCDELAVRLMFDEQAAWETNLLRSRVRHLLERSDDERLLKEIVYCLVYLNSPQDLDIVLLASRSQSPVVRREAAIVASQIPGNVSASVQILLRLVQDQDASVANTAVSSLSNLGVEARAYTGDVYAAVRRPLESGILREGITAALLGSLGGVSREGVDWLSRIAVKDGPAQVYAIVALATHSEDGGDASELCDVAARAAEAPADPLASRVWCSRDVNDVIALLCPTRVMQYATSDDDPGSDSSREATLAREATIALGFYLYVLRERGQLTIQHALERAATPEIRERLTRLEALRDQAIRQRAPSE